MVDFQNKVWGFHFGEKEVRASTVGIIIVGIGFVVISLLSLLNIIHFR